LEDGPPRFPRGSTCPAVLRGSLGCVGISHTGLSPSMDDLSRSFCYPFTSHIGSLQPPGLESSGFGLFRVRSPLLAESHLISSPPGTEMFQFSGFASRCRDDWLLRQPGFPIRRSPDQSLFSGSPKLFAANRVLLRLSAPRHPPFALISLTNPLKATGSSQVLASLLLNPYSVVKDRKAHRALNTRLTLFQSPTQFSVVEVNGIEPMTSCVQGRRSPS
jgi:hypothetical protein